MDHKSGAATYQAAPLCKTRVDIAAQSIVTQIIAVQSIAAQSIDAQSIVTQIIAAQSIDAQSIVTQRMPQTARLP